MNFDFSDEQRQLRESITRYLNTAYDFDARRKRVGSAIGADTVLWADFADRLGILGAALPESAGGLGGGPVETMIIGEALGAALVVEPYLETVVVAGGILKRVAGSRAAALLAEIVTGKSRAVAAFGEPTARYALNAVATTARRDGNGWVLDGMKSVVVGAPDSDHWIVSARTSGGARDATGISLFLVPANTAGIDRRDYRLLDDHRVSDITFARVRVDADALLGEEGCALPLIEQVADEGTAALCAEAVGVMRRMLADTLDYTKQRRQFGQTLASFQVLQHRMVDMYIAVEQSVSAMYLATLKLDADTPERAAAVSAAKVTIANACRFVGQNAVQLHGGMGMTDELAVGHYFKRATVIESRFGSVDHHVARYAALTRAEAA